LLEIDSGNYLKAWNNRSIHKNIDSLLIPKDKLEAYKIQASYETLSKSALFGWKIAATSVDGQKHIGVDGPLAGRLLKERYNKSGASVSLNKNIMKKIEAEFAFKLLNDISPRSNEYSIDEILDSIDSVVPAIEIPDSRFLNFDKVGGNLAIADNAFAGDFILSDHFNSDFKNIDFKNFKVNCYKNKELSEIGIGSNVLGDPLKALTWIINELSSLNINCKKNQIIMTGTCIKPLTVESGDHVIMDFFELGKVDCHFT